MGHKVLITGINSFTGPYLADELANNGFEVFGLSQQPASRPTCTTLNGNLLEQTSISEALDRSRPDYVVHLAAITYVPHGNITEMYNTNVVGTRNLLSAIFDSGITPDKILLASSANVYGNSTVGALGEDTALSPTNDYAVSKVAMEYMAATWANRLPIAIVRPFNYTGVGQSGKFLIPKIVDHFRASKRRIELGNIDVIRDFSDVRFVAAAYRHLLKAAEPGEAYNICSGTGHSLREVIDTMNALSGYKIDVHVNPLFVRENEVRRLVGDNAKLCSLAPSLEPIPLDNTLKWMFEADL